RALGDGTHKISRYQDLAHLIVSEMKRSENPPPAPTFDGDLNRPILAGGAVPLNPAWLVEVDGDKVTVPAGTLHGLAANTVLRLSAVPDGPEWAKATITKAEAIRSVADIGKPIPGERPATLWASVLTPSVSFQLSVAEPPASDLADPAARQFIEKLKEASKSGAIEWVAAQAPAQLRLRIDGGRIWLVGADGEWVRKDRQKEKPELRAYPESFSAAIEPVEAARSVEKFTDLLYKKARAANLVRVAQSWNEALANDGGAKSIVVTAERFVQRGSNDPYRECPMNFSLEGYERVSSLEDKNIPSMSHCDAIRLKVENVGTRDLDLNVSYVDAGGAIVSLSNPCVFTLPAKSSPAVFFARTSNWKGGKNGSPDTVGLEHIVVTALEQKDGIQSNDLCFDQGVPRGINNSSATGTARSFLQTLKDAALAPAGTRGVQIQKAAEDDTQKASAVVFSLEVTPARIQ
ncbi:MAG TPA: hypothetical protein VIH65_05945, partial [Xanthobacteraceae bacterium]